MDPITIGRPNLPRLAGALLVLFAVLTFSAIGAGRSLAQSTDGDGDGYPDEAEEELGSNPAHDDSTPEHFTLLWSCTDGNDNDKDGIRDFKDPGCRSAVPGSPTLSPNPALSGAPAGGCGSGDNSIGSSGPASGDGAGSEGDGSGDSDSDGNGSDTGDEAATGASTDQSGTAGGQGDGGATGSDSTSGESAGGGSGGFPWTLAALIIAAIIAAGAVAYALVTRRRSQRNWQPR